MRKRTPYNDDGSDDVVGDYNNVAADGVHYYYARRCAIPGGEHRLDQGQTFEGADKDEATDGRHGMETGTQR